MLCMNYITFQPHSHQPGFSSIELHILFGFELYPTSQFGVDNSKIIKADLENSFYIYKVCSKSIRLFCIKHTTQRILQVLFNLLQSIPLGGTHTFLSASATSQNIS